MKISKSELIKLGFYHPKLADPEFRYKGADLTQTHNEDFLDFFILKFNCWVSLELEEFENGIELRSLIEKIIETCAEEVEL